jgi:hypothetical protein
MLDPRYPTPLTDDIIEMQKVRPQSFPERVGMMIAFWQRNRKDRKRWEQWADPPQVSAKYAIEVYSLINQSLENPISSNSHRLHQVSQRSADLEYSVAKQLHLLSIAHSHSFLDTFGFLQENGVPFPWESKSEVKKRLKAPVPLGVAPEAVLFQAQVNQIIHGGGARKKAKKTKPNKETSPYVYTIPQTYGADKSDSQNPSQAGESHDGQICDELDDNEPEILNSPEDISHLRHLVKIHQMNTFSQSIELDHSKFAATTITLDQARRMAIRFTNVMTSPLTLSRINLVLQQEVDPLGSFNAKEIRMWKNDRYTAILNTISPFLIKILNDEFQLKGEQGLVTAISGIEQYLFDPVLAQHYSSFHKHIHHFLVPPMDSPQVREEMALEQMRRQLERDNIVQPTGKTQEVEEEEEEEEETEEMEEEMEEEEETVSEMEDEEPQPSHTTQQSTQSHSIKSKSKWNEYEDAIKQAGLKDEEVEAIQFENLRHIYGNDDGQPHESPQQPSSVTSTPSTSAIPPINTATKSNNAPNPTQQPKFFHPQQRKVVPPPSQPKN